MLEQGELDAPEVFKCSCSLVSVVSFTQKIAYNAVITSFQESHTTLLSLWDAFQCVRVGVKRVRRELLRLSRHDQRDSVDDHVLAPQADVGYQ